MTIEDGIFKKYIPDFKKLIKYGFRKNDTQYCYEEVFHNNEFKAVIKISEKGIISAKVFDMESNDEFLPLRIEIQEGAFIGEIRKEYKELLTKIRDNCFLKNYFTFPQSNRITNLIIEKYANYPDFMWEKFDDFGVFKNPDNNKWYAIIMKIDYSKLGLNNHKPVEIINLKLDREKIQNFLKKDGFYPAWHMNKKSWITIVLDETLSDDEIFNLINESYSYTIEPQKKWIIPANPKYFDLEAAFNKENEIIWKQTAKIRKGDILYMYLAAPICAILYKCEVTKADIPYDYKDKNLKINKVMKIKLLKKFDKDFMPFDKLNKYGVDIIRAQRTCPDKLSNIL